jgi:hypothetical protein
MALGSTQPLREMSTRNYPGGERARKDDNLTVICEPIVWKMWETRRLTALWPSTACYMDSFIFYLIPAADRALVSQRADMVAANSRPPFRL